MLITLTIISLAVLAFAALIPFLRGRLGLCPQISSNELQIHALRVGDNASAARSVLLTRQLWPWRPKLTQEPELVIFSNGIATSTAFDSNGLALACAADAVLVIQ